jgi:hypothetical protein
MPLVVRDRDLEGVEIALRMGATVSGTVEAPSHIALEAVRVRLERPSGEPSGAAVSAFLERGPFALSGVVPGEYVVRIDYAQPGIALESVDVAGRNVTDVPIQIDLADFAGLTIRLTDRPASISGAVRRPDGKDSTIASVVLFPTDSSLWSAKPIREPYQFQRTRVQDGKYAFDRVARGEYYLAAVDDALLEEWRDRSLFMALIGRAVRVTVQPGETVQRDFTVDER